MPPLATGATVILTDSQGREYFQEDYQSNDGSSDKKRILNHRFCFFTSCKILLTALLRKITFRRGMYASRCKGVISTDREKFDGGHQ